MNGFASRCELQPKRQLLLMRTIVLYFTYDSSTLSWTHASGLSVKDSELVGFVLLLNCKLRYKRV